MSNAKHAAAYRSRQSEKIEKMREALMDLAQVQDCDDLLGYVRETARQALLDGWRPKA